MKGFANKLGFRATAWLFAAGMIFFFAGHWSLTQASDVKRITKEQLMGMLEAGNPVVIDVRLERHWKESPLKIKGAVRGHPKKFQSWSGSLSKASPLVLYCA